ncbi:MAG: hypothetical protein ACFFCW_27200 [Candidatus Hodarchaeota archaeon]
MPTSRKRCFVIMPFSKTSKKRTEEYWNKHFETFLKPLIEECPELEAYRSEALRGDILRQIISDLVVSPVVVADLTDMNPNVFWELGVRQSFKHCTVTIAERGTKIPFDVSGKGTLRYYPKDYIRNEKFRKKFKKAIKDCLSHPDSPDSHVLETISGRGTLFEIIRRDEAGRRVKALISECEYNTFTLGRIYKTIQFNRKNPEEETKFIADRLRYPAIELLITNRYLDEEDSFYELAETCFARILARNEQLAAWEQSQEATEEWFMASKTKKFDNELKTYEKALKRIQKQPSASY